MSVVKLFSLYFENRVKNILYGQAYGFDYDYTLAIYTFELNQLIYNLALERLIDDKKVGILVLLTFSSHEISC